MGRGKFGVNVRHPIVTKGDFTVKELLFEVVSLVSWEMGVLDGSTQLARRSGGFGGSYPHCLNGIFECIFKTELYLTRLQCFDAAGWAVEGHLACKKQSGGMLACLCVSVKVQICIWSSWCYCHSLSDAPVNWFHLPGFTFLVPAHPGSPGQNPRGP